MVVLSSGQTRPKMRDFLKWALKIYQAWEEQVFVEENCDMLMIEVLSMKIENENKAFRLR